jgi:methionyl-tRNA synthetase
MNYYITTAIDYPNGSPHAGHLYERLIADCYARWHRFLGDKVYFLTGTPYKVNVKQQAYTRVTEVWNLSKDGKSIAVLAKAKSNIWDEERSWKTVFDRID